MKLHTEERTLETTGNVQTREFSVRMDAHMAHILSGLYADIPWALVREYWSNAEDGHDALVRQGKKPPRPIKIHVPNPLEPFFQVTDYGIGMDHDTVFDIYTQYGNSTKNDNNADIGGFGIGAKAAFCYEAGTDQWTLESRFEGIVRNYSAAKDESGMPQLMLFGTAPTDEPTGITITIPVLLKDIPAFKAAIGRFARRRKHEFEIVGDKSGVDAGNYDPIEYATKNKLFGWRKAGSGEHGVQIIMGGVPYPLDLNNQELSLGSKEKAHLNKQGSVDIFLEVGQVDIVPSREALMYTPRTIKCIQATLTTLFSSTVKDFLKELKKQEDHWKAVAYIKANSEAYAIAQSPLGGNNHITWGGYSIGPSSALSVELDDVVAAHTGKDKPDPTKVKALVYQKNWRSITKVATSRPGSYVASPAYTQQHQEVPNTDITLTPEMVTSTVPCVVLADCPGAIGLIQEYWNLNSTMVNIDSGTELYVLQGANLDPKTISKALKGFPVHSVNTLTQDIQQRRKQQGAVISTREPAALWTWQGTYFQQDEVDLNQGGVYVPLHHGDIRMDSVRDVFPDAQSGFTESSLRRIVDSLKVLGHEVDIVGIPSTRLAQVERRANWKCLWTAYKDVITKACNRAIPESSTTTTILMQLEDLSYLQLLKSLGSRQFKHNSPILKLKKAADKLKDKAVAHTNKLNTFMAIRELRTLFGLKGKTSKRGAPKGIDIKPLIRYNEWLGKRYPLIEILRPYTWGLERILTTPNKPHLVEYIEMVDKTHKAHDAPKLS